MKQCSEDGCSSKAHARGLCNKHYLRLWRNTVLDPIPPTLCKEGCGGKAAGRGLCKKHYEQWRRNSPLTGTCKEQDCESPAYTRGWCSRHYQRWLSHGNPDTVVRLTGHEHPAWKGDEVGYAGAHGRVSAQRGSASQYPCSVCDEQAEEWSYDHLDEDQKYESIHTSQVPYSLDPSHYLPMCVPCHRAFDRAHQKEKASCLAASSM